MVVQAITFHIIATRPDNPIFHHDLRSLILDTISK